VSRWVYAEVDGSLRAYDLSKAYRVELVRGKEGELVPASWWLLISYPDGPVRVPLITRDGMIFDREGLEKMEADDEMRAKHAFRKLMGFLEARDLRGL